MNRRELSSQIFISPKDKNKRHRAIHQANAWKTARSSGDDDDNLFDRPFETSNDSSTTGTGGDALNRRKRRLREAKEQAITGSVEAQRRRQQQHEQATLNNLKMQRILEQRRIFDKRLKEDIAMKKAEIKEKGRPKRKTRLKKIIRRKIIKTVLRKHPPPVEVEEDEDFTEVEFDDDEEEDGVVMDEDESDVEEEIVFGDDDESDVEEEIVFGDVDDEVAEETFHEDQDDEVAEETFHEDQDDEVAEESFHEDEGDEMVEETFHEDEDGDEEQFFASIRAENDEEEVSLTESEQFQREQDELFRLAAERQAEEEEDLLWEEEELMREEEARRLAEEEEEFRQQLSPEEQRTQTLQDMIRSRPALKPGSSKRVKPPGEESVLDEKIGYRSPSLMALVNQARFELRPPPPKEHREEFNPVVQDAASIARLVRLNEYVIEAQGQRDLKDFNTTSTDSSYSTWEKNHSQRGQSRKPVQRGNRSNTQIVVNEAATLGKLRSTRKLDEAGLSAFEEIIDIDDLGDEKYDGARVFRTEHLIDRHVGATRQTDWTPDYDDEEYRTLDDVTLPTSVQPRFIPKKTDKTHQELREELSRTVAEGYWDRYYRLERPGAKLNVTPGCFCKYCGSANAWQTYAYQKKWADDRLPPKEQLSENEDPSKFGYISRLYLPDETPEDIDFVDLKEPDEPTKKEYDLGSVDGSCSVDFSLGSLDFIYETDDDGFSSEDKEENSQRAFGSERSQPEGNNTIPSVTEEAIPRTTPTNIAALETVFVAASQPSEGSSPEESNIVPETTKIPVAPATAEEVSSVAACQPAETSESHDAVKQSDPIDALHSASPPEPVISTTTTTHSESVPTNTPTTQRDLAQSSTQSVNEKGRKFKPLKWVKNAIFGNPEKRPPAQENVRSIPTNHTQPEVRQEQVASKSLLQESHPRSSKELKSGSDLDSDVDTVVASNTQIDQIQAFFPDDPLVSMPQEDENVTENQLEPPPDDGLVDGNIVYVDGEQPLKPPIDESSATNKVMRGAVPVKRRKTGILAELHAKRLSIQMAKKSGKLVLKPAAADEDEKPPEDYSTSAVPHPPETDATEPSLTTTESSGDSKNAVELPVKQESGLLGELQSKKEVIELAKIAEIDSKDPMTDVNKEQEGGAGLKVDTKSIANVPVKRKLGLLSELKAKKEALERAKAAKNVSNPQLNDEKVKLVDSGVVAASNSKPDEAHAMEQILPANDSAVGKAEKLADVPVTRKLGLLGELQAKREAIELAKATKLEQASPEKQDKENALAASGASTSSPTNAATPSSASSYPPGPAASAEKNYKVESSMDRIDKGSVKQKLSMLGELKAKKEATARAKPAGLVVLWPPAKQVDVAANAAGHGVAPAPPKTSVINPIAAASNNDKVVVESKKPTVDVSIKRQLGILGDLKSKKEALERAKTAKNVSKPVVKPPKEKVHEVVDKLNTGSEHHCVPPWGDLKFGNFDKKEKAIEFNNQEAPSWKNTESVEKETEEVAQAGRVAAFFMGGR